ncbi:MAG TPA: hypothetical protein VEF04_21630, partial [Blastocatellia bacterium]|nr:hypothetical protein [Blastocatellia bacterium]
MPIGLNARSAATSIREGQNVTKPLKSSLRADAPAWTGPSPVRTMMTPPATNNDGNIRMTPPTMNNNNNVNNVAWPSAGRLPTTLNQSSLPT